jgi:glyoxylase-like metal-dependent hydrolase (beta-lactamase superfamily II)
VADGVLVGHYERLDQNIAVIVGHDGLLVVDSRSTHADADELRSDIAALSPLPVRHLVNTHFHWDHTFGNARFGDADIIGHTRCRDVMVADGEATKRELAQAEWVPADVRWRFLTVDITPPVVTFDGAASVHVGDRVVHMWHPGRGHTDSDIVLAVDDVMIAGDLVEQGAPPSFGDAYPRAWVATLDGLLPSLPSVVVPGHGAIVDAAFVATQRDEIADAIAVADTGRGTSEYPGAVLEVIAQRLEIEDADRRS